VVDPDALARGEVKLLPKGKVGMMLFAPKAGDPQHSSIFDGYMDYEGKQPFVQRPGDERNWFVSGDLGAELPDGYFEFHGRLGRSRKRGGEMVPMDGIENILLKSPVFAEKGGSPDNGKFKVAIVATPKDPDPDFILFTTRDITVAQANAFLKQSGAASVWQVQKVVKVKEIPEGATGKTDYKPFEKLVAQPDWEKRVHNDELDGNWQSAPAALPPVTAGR
jgi:acyl-CoA synthetase (AMP-forming)/AMP-acid ligase II